MTYEASDAGRGRRHIEIGHILLRILIENMKHLSPGRTRKKLSSTSCASSTSKNEVIHKLQEKTGHFHMESMEARKRHDDAVSYGEKYAVKAVRQQKNRGKRNWLYKQRPISH